MTGDILSAVVRADGWSMDVTIEGFAVGATYDFGSLDDTPATVATPMFSAAVVSEGYNAAGVLGTINRTVYGTHVVRKAYPNQASKDETVSGSDIVVRVALSESIYNDDKNGGAGTSGTNPAVTIAAGWATNTGGAAQTSAAATALACTNNSTLDYPKVIAQWAWGHTPAFRRVAAAFDIGCIAYHGHGIACVALSATEGVNVVSGIATSKTAHLMSASALYYESYDLAVPVTTLTQGNDITLKFVAYPLVGDADSTIDTSATTTAAAVPQGWAQITCTCDKTGGLIDYAVVSTTGVDATGAKSTILATAAASPYLTIGKALASGATVVYCRTGTTYALLGSTPASVTQRNYAIEISPYPGEAVTLTADVTFTSWKAKHLRYSGFTINIPTLASSCLSYAGNSLTFSANTFVHSGTWSGGPGERCYATFFTNNTFDTSSVAYASFIGGGANRFGYVLTGNSLHHGLIQTVYGFVANNLSGAGGTDTCRFDEATKTANIELQDNYIIAHNKIHSITQNTNNVMQIFVKATPITGVAIVGNVIEGLSNNQPVASIAGSGSYPANNALVAHNTFAGQRCLLFYNDIGTAAIQMVNVFFRNNAVRSFNIKTDVFAPQNANRIGNWAQVNGVNFSDNVYDGTASSAFVCDWDGINVRWETAKDAVYGSLGYTDDNSYDGGATGNGDYMPTEASVLYDHTLRQAYQSFDLYGVAL